jgi:hypothetical protein
MLAVTTRGTRLVRPTVAAMPFRSVAAAPALSALLAMANAIAGSVPDTSALALNRAVALFLSFVDWIGVGPAVNVVIAFIVARCAPPVDLDLPPGFTNPVLPTTAVANVDCLRRAARKCLPRMSVWLEALEAGPVVNFCTEIGGRVKRLKSQKKPFLFVMVEKAWKMWGHGSLPERRDATAIVVGFFYGCRASELAAMRRGDVEVLHTGVVRVVFKARKNRRTVLGTHDPQIICAQHHLLTTALRTWLARLDGLGATALTPLFPAMRGLRMNTALDAATFRSMVRKVDPQCVAHSLRAGMATEAWAAGVPLESIMALGGWTSPVATMYIIGSVEETVAASSRLGSAGMRYEADALHARLGTARLQRSTWTGLT